MKSRMVTVSSWLLVVTGIIYCVSRLRAQQSALPDFSWSLLLFAKLFVLLLLVQATPFIFSQGWRKLLAAMELRIGFLSAFSIIGRAQIGKYLPGNVFHYVGRAAIGMQEGLPSAAIAVTISLETLLVLCITGLLALYGLSSDQHLRGWIEGVVPSMDGMMLTLVGSCAFIVGALLLYRKTIGTLPCRITRGKLALLIEVASLYFVIFVVYGVIFKLIPWAVWGSVSSVTIVNSVWRFALCYLAGFIVPGAPAGLGVREAFFTKLFAPELGEGGAACVALVFRVLTIIGDLLTFVVAWWVGSRTSQQTRENIC